LAVSKKYKRKLIRHDKVFYWYVKADYDDAGKINVHVLSEDKNFIVAYELGQVSEQKKIPFIVVVGKESLGYKGERTGWIRVQTPIWDDLSATPSFVGTIIDWCSSEKEKIVLVDWKGEFEHECIQ
jgi:hypothetical protein